MIVPVEVIKDLRTLGVDILSNIRSIYTRVGDQLSLIECLDRAERLIGRESQFLIRLNLERGKVKEMRRSLFPLLLRHLCDREGLTRDLIQYLLRLIDRAISPCGGSKGGLPVDRLDLPIGLGDKVLYLLRPLDDEGQSRRLHTSHRE